MHEPGERDFVMAYRMWFHVFWTFGSLLLKELFQ